MSKKDPLEPLDEALRYWEGYDNTLTTLENFRELQLSMGLLDEARNILEKIAQK